MLNVFTSLPDICINSQAPSPDIASSAYSVPMELHEIRKSPPLSGPKTSVSQKRKSISDQRVKTKPIPDCPHAAFPIQFNCNNVAFVALNV